MLTISFRLAARGMITFVIIFAAVMLPLDNPNDRAVRPIPKAKVKW